MSLRISTIKVAYLLNDALFGAIYYRMLLRSGPLTRRFGEELVEQVLLGNRLEPGRGRSN